MGVPSIMVGGLPIAVIDRVRSAALMIARALGRRGAGRPPIVITSANGQVLSLCARDPQIRELFLAADFIHADGTPMVFASRLKGAVALPERVATTDLFNDVALAAECVGATFYLLGGAPGVIERAVRNVRKAHPRLVLSGFRHGYFGPAEEAEIIADINRARPDILWVGRGVPFEQEFAIRCRDRLTGVGLIKTSGGLFDFLAGKNHRAPAWMQAAGLEWLHRLALEPRRLGMRYLTSNPHALYLLLARTSREPPVR